MPNIPAPFTLSGTRLAPLIPPQWASFCYLDWYREHQVFIIEIVIFTEFSQYAGSIMSVGRMPTRYVALGK